MSTIIIYPRAIFIHETSIFIHFPKLCEISVKSDGCNQLGREKKKFRCKNRATARAEVVVDPDTYTAETLQVDVHNTELTLVD